MWQVSALLAKAEQLPAEVTAKLNSRDATELPPNLKRQVPNSR
jgi:hypothetical protein